MRSRGGTASTSLKPGGVLSKPARATLSFTSQHGVVDVASLPVVSGSHEDVQAGRGSGSVASTPASEKGQHGGPWTGQPPPAGPPGSDVFTTLEKLAQLHAKGVLSNEEFADKKAELLGRL